MIWLLLVVLAVLVIRWACRFIDRAEETLIGMWTERDDELDAGRDISNNLDI